MRHLAPASLPCVWNGQPHVVSKIRTTLQIRRTYCNGFKIIPICLTKGEVGLFSKQIYIPTKQARSQHSNRNFVFLGHIGQTHQYHHQLLKPICLSKHMENSPGNHLSIGAVCTVTDQSHGPKDKRSGRNFQFACSF